MPACNFFPTAASPDCLLLFLSDSKKQLRKFFPLFTLVNFRFHKISSYVFQTFIYKIPFTLFPTPFPIKIQPACPRFFLGVAVWVYFFPALKQLPLGGFYPLQGVKRVREVVRSLCATENVLSFPHFYNAPLGCYFMAWPTAIVTPPEVVRSCQVPVRPKFQVTISSPVTPGVSRLLSVFLIFDSFWVVIMSDLAREVHARLRVGSIFFIKYLYMGCNMHGLVVFQSNFYYLSLLVNHSIIHSLQT